MRYPVDVFDMAIIDYHCGGVAKSMRDLSHKIIGLIGLDQYF